MTQLECTSSSLTPGFHCPDTRSYCERLGRLYGNGSKRVRERTWSPKSSTILSEWVDYAEKSSFSCLTDHFPSADVAVFVYRLCKGRCLIRGNSCWAHKLLKSSFWSNLSILCLLCCSIVWVWNTWKGKDIASIAGRMLLCSAYFAISQFPAHTDHELQYFTILEHVLSLEIGLPAVSYTHLTLPTKLEV